MKKLYAFAFLILSTISIAQVKGIITDVEKNPLPFVNVFIENTYTGSTTNENGLYEVTVKNPEKVTLVFQYLGYKTQKHTLTNLTLPYTFNVVLVEESFQFQELVLENGINPANEIIKKAQKFKKRNADKTDKFEADFYSRGIFKAKNIPKKFMGVEIGDIDGSLDSTRSGVLYLSETVSKIKFEKPNNLKEEIIASKIAGDDNGFSYNTAINTNYDFYENYVNFNINMVSPIADNAFNYYKYKLESTFYDKNNQLINKILVSPKRDKEPVFEGYIYIVEDTWAIYGIDLDIKGYRMQEPILETMKLIQNFSYNSENKLWVKNVQSLDFDAGIFGMKFTGKFTHVFSNYVFKPAFEKKTFTNEIVSFANNSNKKENDFWETTRPVPLTDEEIKSYVKKDSIQTVRKSQTYLDSIDATTNKFKIQKIITGYTYKNTFKSTTFNYEGLLNLSSLSFNTVQGYNIDSGFNFRKFNEEKGSSTFVSTNFNYGFAEDRLRVNGRFFHRFNNTNRANISLTGGSAVSQFNENEPISKLVNSVSTLFFKNNFMKLYNKEFAKISYGQEVINGISLAGSLEYENRHALLNNTDYTVLKSNDIYSSNDPLNPLNTTIASFNEHFVAKANINATINFGQKYITRPDGKFNIGNDTYPVLRLGYEKAFTATNANYEYDLVTAALNYDKTAGNKGEFKLQLKAGKFFHADNIAFIDYKHFNGNLTHVNFRSNYLNSFNLLPYYSSSTNDAYFETHIQHDFKGYIMNKIPLLNKLQWNLIAGFHQLAVPDRKPYQEFTLGFGNIGFGKFRALRVDYVRSYQNGFVNQGVMFGIQL